MREKEVRETEIWPRREGDSGWPGGFDERSRLRAVDCLRAVLNRVFCLHQIGEQKSGGESITILTYYPAPSELQEISSSLYEGAVVTMSSAMFSPTEN